MIKTEFNFKLKQFMKLRCETNSIRLRLRRSEIEQLLQIGQVEEQVAFGPERSFRYVLRLDALQDDILAQAHPYGLELCIPEKLGRNWCLSDMVGLEANQPIDGKDQLQLLIEKDFPCVTRPDEDPNDFFQELAQKSDQTC